MELNKMDNETFVVFADPDELSSIYASLHAVEIEMEKDRKGVVTPEKLAHVRGMRQQMEDFAKGLSTGGG